MQPMKLLAQLIVSSPKQKTEIDLLPDKLLLDNVKLIAFCFKKHIKAFKTYIIPEWSFYVFLICIVSRLKIKKSLTCYKSTLIHSSCFMIF